MVERAALGIQPEEYEKVLLLLKQMHRMDEQSVLGSSKESYEVKEIDLKEIAVH